MHWLYEAILVLETVAAAGCAAALLIHGYFMLRNRVPYVRLPQGAMGQVSNELEIGEGDRLIDLGSGDGRVLMALARACPGASFMGVENDWVVWLGARLRTPNFIRLRCDEIANVSLDQATKVFAYLGPELMTELEPRFERELPAGARVVSAQFPLPTRKPDKVVNLKNSAPFAARLYVYNY